MFLLKQKFELESYRRISMFKIDVRVLYTVGNYNMNTHDINILGSTYTYLATDPSNIFTLSASAAKAFTTALIVLLSLPKSSSLCASRFGFLPILLSLDRRKLW